MLVWQDMVNPNQGLSKGAKTEFERQDSEILNQLHNHPSITTWVLFNEKWGQYDQQRLTEWIKKTDPSRIVNGHTGELLYVNKELRSPSPNAYVSADMTDVHDCPGPGIGPYLPGKVRVLGEWGGVRVVTPGHEWDPSKGWGYIQSAASEFARKYEFMIRHLKLFEEEGLSASIYTQPFDVEIEENGLITYDRENFKIPVDKIKAINALMFTK
jgi:Glycosyl hydrolases family 2, TIM barrel domain